jgi:opacity protein-like surface antigen
MKRITALGAISLFAVLPSLHAQTSKLAINGGGGVTLPVGDTGARLNTGWNITLGGGYNFVPRLGVMGEFTYNRFDINQATLNALSQPDGNLRLWAFTADPIVRLNPGGRLDFYVIGGGGIYHRVVEFTRPTVTTVTVFDPFFGFYNVFVPANEVLSSFATTKGGLNIGGGIAFRLGSSRVKVYTEARYHHMFTRTATTILPVTFGLRW